jgi:hypothetical protein
VFPPHLPGATTFFSEYLLMSKIKNVLKVMQTIIGKLRGKRVLAALPHYQIFLTIHPLKEGQREYRIPSGMWRWILWTILKYFMMNNRTSFTLQKRAKL